MSNLTENQISILDAAIAEAKAKTKAPKSDDPTTSKDERKSEREAKRAQLAEERAERRAAREAKKAERESQKKMLPDTARLVTAEARLPQLSLTASDALAAVFGTNPSEADLAIITSHLQHGLRSRQTIRAATGTEIQEGQTVVIKVGEPRFVGKIGVVTKISRIRCHIQLEGREKPLYVFTSDVSPVEAETEIVVVATGTDG